MEWKVASDVRIFSVSLIYAGVSHPEPELTWKHVLRTICSSLLFFVAWADAFMVDNQSSSSCNSLSFLLFSVFVANQFSTSSVERHISHLKFLQIIFCLPHHLINFIHELCNFRIFQRRVIVSHQIMSLSDLPYRSFTLSQITLVRLDQHQRCLCVNQ